jgi:pyruvate dehydrogenase E1 component alpha subunit
LDIHKSEVEELQQRDPIVHVSKVIVEQKWMTEAELKSIDKEVKAQVEEAIKFAEESPLPDAHELYEDVYVTPDYPFVND